LHKTYSKIDSW